jgi:hypothetical protein
MAQTHRRETAVRAAADLDRPCWPSFPTGGERMPIIWHATTKAGLELLAAVGDNCTCIFDFDAEGARVSVCDAHAALAASCRSARESGHFGEAREHGFSVCTGDFDHFVSTARWSADA